MTINLLALTVSLISLGILFFVLIRLRDNSQLTQSKTDKIEEKINSFSDGMGKIIQELASVTTPINELNRFLGGNVTTGRLGEWSLESIVQDIMPDGSYHFQHIINPQTSDQVDCAVISAEGIKIPIDSKFYSGLYKNYQKASTDKDRKTVLRDLRNAILNDASDISEKYIIEGETADGAILFLPSEAIYAELHANFSKLVNEGFDSRVWIVSPTTLMATLNTMRAILKDERLRRQTSRIRAELDLLYKDMLRLEGRIINLDKHFNLASKDVDEIKISAKKAAKRVFSIERFEFEELPRTDTEDKRASDEVKKIADDQGSKKIKLI